MYKKDSNDIITVSILKCMCVSRIDDVCHRHYGGSEMSFFFTVKIWFGTAKLLTYLDLARSKYHAHFFTFRHVKLWEILLHICLGTIPQYVRLQNIFTFKWLYILFQWYHIWVTRLWPILWNLIIKTVTQWKKKYK